MKLSDEEIEEMFDALEHLKFLGDFYAAVSKDKKNKRFRKLYEEVSRNIHSCLGDIKFVKIENN